MVRSSQARTPRKSEGIEKKVRVSTRRAKSRQSSLIRSNLNGMDSLPQISESLKRPAEAVTSDDEIDAIISSPLTEHKPKKRRTTSTVQLENNQWNRKYFLREDRADTIVGKGGPSVVAAAQDTATIDNVHENLSTSNLLTDEVRSDGEFRKVHIRFDGDVTGERARIQCVMHDTGAGCSLTFESKLTDLGLDYERFDEETSRPEFTSVTGEVFHPKGKRQICYSYSEVPEKKHWADLLVLSDPNQGMEPAYDILLGRDTLKKTKALTWDYNVIGKGVHHIHLVPEGRFRKLTIIPQPTNGEMSHI